MHARGFCFSDGLEDATRFVWDGKYTYIYTPGFLRVFGTNSRLKQRLERLATIAKNKRWSKKKISEEILKMQNELGEAFRTGKYICAAPISKSNSKNGKNDDSLSNILCC